MTVGFLVYGVVPVVVVMLMMAVGLHVRLTDLRQILERPRSLVITTALQIVLLPSAALTLIAIIEPTPLIALVVLAISVSPGGALSNAFTLLAGGNLALSILMTVLTTLLVSVVAPLVLAFASAAGLIRDEVTALLDPVSVAWDLARFALLPICAGLLCASFLPSVLPTLRRVADSLSLVAIAVLLTCSAIVSWPFLLQTATMTVLHAAVFSLASLAMGTAVSRLLPAYDRSACVIEFGVRNLPIALFLATGSSPSPEVVAFLLAYFILNTAILLALSLVKRTAVSAVTA